MTAALKLVNFPAPSGAKDIPTTLRELADSIEAGSFGDAHNLAWVIDRGSTHGGPAIGLMGHSASPGAEAHLLFAVAQHVLTQGSI